MLSGYAAIFTDCLETSTAHGIAKIRKESYLIFKLLWALLFILAMFLFSYHSSILIQKWQEMPTSVEIIASTEPFDLPDLYICPTNILSHYHENQSQTEEMKTLRENITKSIKEIRKGSTLKNKNTFLYRLWRQIPMGNLFKYFGLKPSDLIISGFTNNRFLHINEFETIPDNEYISCIKLQLSKTARKENVRSFTMFLYIKSLSVTESIRKHFIIDGIDFYNLDFLHFLRSKHLIRFYVLSKNEAKLETSPYITLKRGQQHFLKISTKRFQRVNRPQNPCKDVNGSRGNLKQYYNFLDPDNPRNILPTSICEAIEKQNAMFRRSGCYDKFEFIPNIFPKDRFCQDVVDWSTINSTDIERKCKGHTPCNTTSYGIDINIDDLPEPGKLKSFINAIKAKYFTAGKKCGNSYAVNSLCEDVERANKTELVNVMNNIIKFQIDFGEDKKLLYHEKLSYTATNLLSDIGGIFGFYMGISILTLCEIMVLFCHLIIGFIRKNGDGKARDKDFDEGEMISNV